MRQTIHATKANHAGAAALPIGLDGANKWPSPRVLIVARNRPPSGSLLRMTRQPERTARQLLALWPVVAASVLLGVALALATGA